ncbi:TnsD family transposase [Priestia aryabhattai]|uniref:TnsD family Tn7-like transposition protein n=1 Tax=Priestia aryabhattai TaxID=412384 RepID=UPI001C8E3950|nr:TnsD family Tn7-like transposition protein [Priestia aryabhattai]MBY0025613.1 TnsD family transposase [Priestia aryabhattai]
MIFNFPKPYPDELLYSILSRYHYRVGNISPKHTTEEIYGKRTVRSVCDLPSHLQILEDRINNPYLKSDYFIDFHTLFPYYGAFLLPEQRQLTRELLKGTYGSRIHTTSGISASNIKVKGFFMHCEMCCEEDMNRFGEMYWHRTHQLPGVYICHKHNVVLHETSIPIKSKNQHEYIIANSETVFTNIKYKKVDESQKEPLFILARMTHELLQSSYEQQGSNYLRNEYKKRLMNIQLCSPNGYVHRIELYQSFKSFYSEELLEKLQSPINQSESNWLSMIFRNHRKSFHPIRHLLVMMFFEEELGNFYKRELPYKPFGQGPWYCLNVTCTNYLLPVIKDIKITRCYDTRKPVGTFTCSCGFIYSRRGPDMSKEDKYKIGRVKDFGAVWKENLLKLIRKGGTLRGIAKQLHCDPKTVKRQAALLRIPFSWEGESLEEASDKLSVKNSNCNLPLLLIEEKRNEWVSLQKSNPRYSITQLRRIRPDLYMYIYRHDYEWLQKNSLNVRVKSVVNNRVSWPERDEELLKLVHNALESWDKDLDKPIRITATGIGRKINKLAVLQKKQDKLPKTISYINSVAESIEDFQLRRLKWAVKEMQNNGEEVKGWKLIRKAGLSKSMSNKIREMVTKLCE